jgi:hypothetical protein
MCTEWRRRSFACACVCVCQISFHMGTKRKAHELEVDLVDSPTAPCSSTAAAAVAAAAAGGGATAASTPSVPSEDDVTRMALEALRLKRTRNIATLELMRMIPDEATWPVSENEQEALRIRLIEFFSHSLTLVDFGQLLFRSTDPVACRLLRFYRRQRTNIFLGEKPLARIVLEQLTPSIDTYEGCLTQLFVTYVSNYWPVRTDSPGWTLIDACLLRGVGVDTPVHHQRSALSNYLSQRVSFTDKVLLFLVSRGANLTHVDDVGHTPLMYMIDKKRVSLLTTLYADGHLNYANMSMPQHPLLTLPAYACGKHEEAPSADSAYMCRMLESAWEEQGAVIAPCIRRSLGAHMIDDLVNVVLNYTLSL